MSPAHGVPHPVSTTHTLDMHAPRYEHASRFFFLTAAGAGGILFPSPNRATPGLLLPRRRLPIRSRVSLRMRAVHRWTACPLFGARPVYGRSAP